MVLVNGRIVAHSERKSRDRNDHVTTEGEQAKRELGTGYRLTAKGLCHLAWGNEPFLNREADVPQVSVGAPVSEVLDESRGHPAFECKSSAARSTRVGPVSHGIKANGGDEAPDPCHISGVGEGVGAGAVAV